MNKTTQYICGGLVALLIGGEIISKIVSNTNQEHQKTIETIEPPKTKYPVNSHNDYVYGFREVNLLEPTGIDLKYLWANPVCLEPEQMGLIGMPFELKINSQGEPYLKYIGPDTY
jgi:hypothetical protein